MKTNHALAPFAVALFSPHPGESNRTDDLGQVTMLLHNWVQHSDDFGQVTMLLHNWSLKHNQFLPSHLPYFINNCKLQLYYLSWSRKKLFKTSPITLMVQEKSKTFHIFFWKLLVDFNPQMIDSCFFLLFKNFEFSQMLFLCLYSTK